MAFGKNKKVPKGGKKGGKNKQDKFAKKVWYDIRAPSYLGSASSDDKKRLVNFKRCGLTVVSKTAGQRTESEGLMGRVAEINLADLNGNSDDSHRKVKLEVQETQGKACLTEFHSMGFTRDKMCQMVKTKQSLIEAFVDCKTTDGYVVRLFVIAFTKRANSDKTGNDANRHIMTRRFCYAQSAQVKKIRQRIVAFLSQEVAKGSLQQGIKNIISSTWEDKLKKLVERIYPCEPIHIFKAKLVKKPKFDITRLLEVHNKADDSSMKVAKEEEPEAKNLVA